MSLKEKQDKLAERINLYCDALKNNKELMAKKKK